MNYAVYNIALDIHKTGSQVALSMIRGENKRKIVVSLTENGRPYNIADGCTAMFAAKKPDEKPIYNDCKIDYENNLIIYNVTSQTTAAMGEVICQIELIGNDGGLLFSPTFSLIVANKLYNQEPILASSEEFNALTAYVANLQKKLADGEFKGDKGDKGDRGPQGIQGETGPAGKDADTSSLSPAIVCTATGSAITVSDSSDSALEGFSIYGKSTQNGTPTPTAPIEIVSVGDGSGINAAVYKKNLIPFPYKETSPKTSNGMTFTVKNDGGILVEGTPNAASYYVLYKGRLFTNGIMTFSMSGNATNMMLEVSFFDAENTKIASLSSDSSTYVVDIADYPLAKEVQVVIKRAKDNVVVNGTVYVQCELGNKSTTYMPYDKQNITLTTPLRAIPVTDSNLATYTDANGQMWCADEIDLERGVYVQRLVKMELTGTEEWGNTSDNEFRANITSTLPNTYFDGVWCTHYRQADKGVRNVHGTIIRGISGYQIFICDNTFGNDVAAFAGALAEKYKNGNPVTVYCRRATPIETPLTSEQIAQYKALKTNYPSTTILNDENAFMKVGYRADTKKFIERFAGSTTQISSVTLAASKWVGTGSPYSQVVTIPGATNNSKINLNPTVEQLNIFHNKDLAFVVGNKNGVITVYCIGQKPANDYTMQVSITEVNRI